jgi:signal transduction histidine kinase
LNSPSAAHRDLLAQHPFPELASALRSQQDRILETWVALVREALPVTRALSFDELKDNIPAILAGMADALESGGGEAVAKLIEASPQQGLTRYRQKYNLVDLMLEDRLLRRVIVEGVGASLGRALNMAEDMALHTAIDLMLQQAVIALVGQQQEKLRIAAEAELKYLSFLSHDLNNNLGSVTLWLQVLRDRLSNYPEFEEDVETVEAIQQSILDTIAGMGRILQAERLRKAGVAPKAGLVHLQKLARNIVRQLSQHAQRKGVTLSAEVPAEAVLRSDSELISLVMQNLVGNGIKYSKQGTVRISAQTDGSAPSRQWVLSVSDEGPGIAPEQMKDIFEAFRRGESHGQDGVGLGLAIVSQAAKLLGAEVTVESKVGNGSTFSVKLADAIDGGGMK